MVTRPTKILLTISLGTLLVVNPVMGVPGHPTKQYTYAAEPVSSPLDVELTESYEREVRRCIGLSRQCLFERRAVTDPIRVPRDETRNVTELTRYSFVRLPDGFYRPTVRVTNDSYVLGLEPVSQQVVLRTLARDELPRFARGAVPQGTVTVTEPLGDEPLYDSPILVRYNDTYYVVSVVESEIKRPIPEEWRVWVDGLRLVGVVTGFGLLLYGYNLPD